MNWLSLALGLIPGIVSGIEKIVGDKASGATKKQMAHDALDSALNATSTVLTGTNATYAQAAHDVVGLAIDQTVNIAKASGTYQKWTASATAAQQDAGVAAAVVQLVQSVQGTPAPAAAPVAANTVR